MARNYAPFFSDHLGRENQRADVGDYRNFRSDVRLLSGTDEELSKSRTLAKVMKTPDIYFATREKVITDFIADFPQEIYNKVYNLLVAGKDTNGVQILKFYQYNDEDGTLIEADAEPQCHIIPAIPPQEADAIAYQMAINIADEMKKIIDRVLPPSLVSLTLDKMHAQANVKYTGLV